MTTVPFDKQSSGILIRTMDIELGSITAYREWRFGLEAGLPSLFSMSALKRWPYGVVEASCILRKHEGIDAPVMDCSCGIYAMRRPLIGSASQFGEPPRFGTIAGEVELFGKIIIHERGYRAQYAKVTKLYDLFRCDYCSGVFSLQSPGYVLRVMVREDRITSFGFLCKDCYSAARFIASNDIRLYEAEYIRELVVALRKLYT